MVIGGEMRYQTEGENHMTTRINYMDLVDRLGADLKTLNDERKDKNGISRGKYLVIELGGQEIKLDPPLVVAINKAITDALSEGQNGSC